MVYYPKPLHLQTALAYLGHGEGDFPISEEMSTRIFSVPMHPYLADEQVAAIVAAMAGIGLAGQSGVAALSA